MSVPTRHRVAVHRRTCRRRRGVMWPSMGGPVAGDRAVCRRRQGGVSPATRARVEGDIPACRPRHAPGGRRELRMSRPTPGDVARDAVTCAGRHARMSAVTGNVSGATRRRLARDPRPGSLRDSILGAGARNIGPLRATTNKRSGPCGPPCTGDRALAGHHAQEIGPLRARSVLPAGGLVPPGPAGGGQATWPRSPVSALRCGRRRNRLESAACNPSRPWLSPKSRIAL